jgi:hypothetical protein
MIYGERTKIKFNKIIISKNDLIIKNIFAIILLMLFSNRLFSQDTIKRIDKQMTDKIQKSGTWEKPQIEIKKHWISNSGDYLFMYTNIYNPHGYYTLNYNTEQEKTVNFEGSQQGNKIYFKGFNPESFYRPIMEFSGVIDANNFLIGTWCEIPENGKKTTLKKVTFSPVNNLKPMNYKIQTYVSNIEHNLYISKLKIMFNTSGKQQILENFIARPITNELLLEDFNFDGYLDIAMYYDFAIENGREEYSLFWLYNPTTQQFEPSNFLNQSKVMYSSADAQKKQLEVSSINKKNFKSTFYYVKFEKGKAVGLKEAK